MTEYKINKNKNRMIVLITCSIIAPILTFLLIRNIKENKKNKTSRRTSNRYALIFCLIFVVIVFSIFLFSRIANISFLEESGYEIIERYSFDLSDYYLIKKDNKYGFFYNEIKFIHPIYDTIDDANKFEIYKKNEHLSYSKMTGYRDNKKSIIKMYFTKSTGRHNITRYSLQYFSEYDSIINIEKKFVNGYLEKHINQ